MIKQVAAIWLYLLFLIHCYKQIAATLLQIGRRDAAEIALFYSLLLQIDRSYAAEIVPLHLYYKQIAATLLQIGRRDAAEIALFYSLLQIGRRHAATNSCTNTAVNSSYGNKLVCYPFKKILFVIFYFKLFKEIKIFFFKCPFFMMFLLI